MYINNPHYTSGQRTLQNVDQDARKNILGNSACNVDHVNQISLQFMKKGVCSNFFPTQTKSEMSPI